MDEILKNLNPEEIIISLNVNIPLSLYESLKVIAETRGITVEELAREILELRTD